MFDWLFPLILIGSGLVVASVFTSLIAFRFGAPVLLVLLGLGLLVGEDGLGLQFSDASTAYAVGSLALAIILFDSGFGTSLRAFREAAAPALTLATVGVLLTTGLVGVAASVLFGFTLAEGLLLGALVSSTDAAAVFFLLRVGGVHIRDRVRSTLEVESGSNDPMAIFLTIMLLEVVAAGAPLGSIGMDLVVGFVMQMGIGLVAGLIGGWLTVQMVNRVSLEGALYPIVVTAFSLCIFALTGILGGSGFLAVYAAGLYAGNRRLQGAASLRRFQTALTWLAQITMFVLLGLLATPSAFPSVALSAIGLALFLIFLARPLAIWLCLLPFSFRRSETAFVSWVGLRGAVSILLAILPLAQGLPNGDVLFNTAFIVVLVSLLLQGSTIAPVARRLGLIVPKAIGPVEKIELELPGTGRHEMIVYRVVPDSAVLQGERLPRWARPSLVVRDGQSIRYQYAGRLQAGDYVYILTPPRFTKLLDRLFASPVRLDANDHDFFGEFVIDPAKRMESLEKTYELKLSRTERALPVRDFILSRLGDSAEVGDRVAIGDADLIVREVDGNGMITSVGLTPGTPEPYNLPIFLNGRETLAMVRRMLSGARGGRKPVEERRVEVDGGAEAPAGDAPESDPPPEAPGEGDPKATG